MPQLIFEIGCEELPAGYIRPALAGMKAAFERQLADHRLNASGIFTEGTPRRLVLLVQEMDGKQASLEEEVTGPKEAIAYKDGKLSLAGLGFLKGRGLTEVDAYLKETKKGKVLAAKLSQKGEVASQLLPDMLDKILHQIPFPKRMHWEASNTYFARPINWICAVFDGDAVQFEVAGIKSDAKTCGHRFAHPDFVAVKGIEGYKSCLDERDVTLSQSDRKQLIVDASNQLLGSIGGKLYADPKLLDTVSNLVEKPWPLLGSFDEKFLAMPKEIAIAEMVEHQKYFPVVGDKGELLNRFVVIAGSPASGDVVHGHERVLRARLEDGLFYYEKDLKTPLSEMAKGLEKLAFHRQLGSVAEKIERMKKVVTGLPRIGGDPSDVDAAIQLCKADLLSGAVGEFPELQGVMGRIYALKEGVDVKVAQAIEEHYWPKFAGDKVPSTDLGAVVALADRADNLTSFAGIGKLPKGSADPFGLRRAAIAVCAIILERGYHLNLPEMFESKDVLEFVRSRLRVMLFDELKASGFDGAKRAVDSAMAVGSDDLVDLKARLDAVVGLMQADVETFDALAETIKRACNIVQKARADGIEIGDLDAGALQHSSEQALGKAVTKIADSVFPAKAGIHADSGNQADYPQLLMQIANLHEPLAKFFDDVMVMDKDPKVRDARLALLAKVEALANQVADFKRL